MIARISRVVLEALSAEAARADATECCGLLLGKDDCIDAFLPARNVAAEPHHRFEIDPVTLIAAHRAERHGGSRILGCYHSHPGGDASPSREDAAQAAANGWLWAIVAGPLWRAAFWRATGDGPEHGRFETVAIQVEECVQNLA